MCSSRHLALVVATVIGVLAVPSITHADDTHVVAPGDTLIGIADSAGIRLSELLRANDLQLTSLILPGQHLTIPGSSTPSAATAHPPDVYTAVAKPSMHPEPPFATASPQDARY